LTGQVTTSSKPFSLEGNSSVVLGRGFVNLGGYDFSLQGGSVYGGYYAGFGVAGEVATLGVRGEVSGYHPRNNPPILLPSGGPTPTQIQPYIDHARAVVGFERRFESSLYITAEYFFNGAAPGNNNYILPSIQQALGETPNISRHLIGVVFSYDIIPTVVARLSGIVGIASEPSALITPLIDWSAAENADFQLGALIGVGQSPTNTPAGPQPNSEFGTSPTLFYMQFKVYF
jgi:hypothetical protein